MSTTESSESMFQGRVKWFNNKAGYGFITIIDGVDVGDKVGMDIFSHHSAITVGEEQYKYLVQGEYVEFSLSPVEGSEEHKFQAATIKGLKGGKLLCETRNKGDGPREYGEEWVLSKKKKSTGKKTTKVEKPEKSED